MTPRGPGRGRQTHGVNFRRVVLATLLVYIALLGGTEAGVFTPELKAVNAVIGAAIIVWWAALLRRGSDRTDLVAMVGLLAFLAACVFSAYPRQSFEPAVAAVAWAGAFGVARRETVNPASRAILIRLLGLVALLLAVYVAMSWGGVWVDWVRVAGSAPPLNLRLPHDIFRHYYVIAMLLATLLPASVALFPTRWRVIALPAAVVSVALILGSGSRGTWLAVVLAALAFMSIHIERGRGWERGRLLAVFAAAGTVVVAGVVGLLGTGLWESLSSRLLTSSTISYRADLWLHTLELAAADPLTGIGPGAHAIGISLTGLLEQYRWEARHADNALIQLVGEAGVLGLITAVCSVSAVVIGWRRRVSGANVGAIGLVIFAGSSLANNPTDTPAIVAVAIAHAALVAPLRQPHHPAASVSRRWTVATGVLALSCGAVVGAAVASTTVAGMMNREARQHATERNWPQAIAVLDRAIRLDPHLALYRKERGILQLEAGQPVEAMVNLRRAVELNPADTAGLRALAIAHGAIDDPASAMAAAGRAVEIAPMFEENHLALAKVSEFHDRAAADDASVHAIAVAPWITAAPGWDASFASDLDEGVVLERAWALVSLKAPSAREATALAWLASASGQSQQTLDHPSIGLTTPLAALSAVLDCDMSKALRQMETLGDEWIASTPGIVARVMIARLDGRQALEADLAAARLRHPELALAAIGPLPEVSLFHGLSENARMYRSTGLAGAVPGPAVPRSLNGLNAWLLDPRSAALAGAPESGLAECSR